MSDEVTPSATNTARKSSVIWKDVKNLPLYDVDMVVDEDHIPPEGVILSSDLAYKVIRLVLQTGIMSLRTLADYWPANFTTMGTPVVTIEPLGKPALIKTEDGDIAYGAYNGYVYAGTHGFKKMTGTVMPEVLQMDITNLVCVFVRQWLSQVRYPANTASASHGE
ncbi:hypothetical protein SLS56_005668 [Neofusicoccum ribis]|uniref:Uncharacterized protein n=1 Tax=Neofusicoccum ribis TaxID=45134 RepID=A0ABR3SSS9_9PEZI